MFGSPYFNNYRENQPQQPIQNIINTQMPLNNVFLAQYLKENEKVEEMFVNHKTAFIDLKNKQLKIKEIDGNIVVYGLVLPRDEKDEKIEQLERQILELKGMIMSEPNGYVPTDNESTEQNGNVGKFNKTKFTIK
nr:hypothetical protein [Clostridia bacterium]